ncbi:MAG: hypothetical protein JKY65_32925 [Planctomycetes bacterium]|nr:hypothetical protein [Planctomycetota bacterium]
MGAERLLARELLDSRSVVAPAAFCGGDRSAGLEALKGALKGAGSPRREAVEVYAEPRGGSGLGVVPFAEESRDVAPARLRREGLEGQVERGPARSEGRQVGRQGLRLWTQAEPDEAASLDDRSPHGRHQARTTLCVLTPCVCAEQEGVPERVRGGGVRGGHCVARRAEPAGGSLEELLSIPDVLASDQGPARRASAERLRNERVEGGLSVRHERVGRLDALPERPLGRSRCRELHGSKSLPKRDQGGRLQPGF